MESVFTFIWSALPLIVTGLALAVFFAQNAKKIKRKDDSEDYGTEGMCIGMCAGSAISGKMMTRRIGNEKLKQLVVISDL